MGTIKKQSLYKRLLYIFFKQNKLISEMENIREVYFGLRARILGILVLVMIITIAILTTIMYFNNRKQIEGEKNAKARSLTQILAGPAEFYLDKNIEDTKDELETKYGIIERESKNFIAYNDDIVKILLADESGRIRFSTKKQDYDRKNILTYIKAGLSQKEEKLLSYDYSVEFKNRKTGKKNNKRFRAITYPIFLHMGTVVNVLPDFNRLYPEYYIAEKNRKNQIYLYLWNKYKNILGEDFDPAKKKKIMEPVQQKNIKLNKPVKGKPVQPGISKLYDIDFLFLSLLSHCITFRNKHLPANEAWMLNDKWLFAQKENKNKAYQEDDSTKVKEIDDLIISRLTMLSERVDKSKRLGVLAVVFNVDTIKKSSARNIQQIVVTAIIIIVLSGIAILVVLNYYVKNIKKLERWSISVGQGNIDEKIYIASNDEVGRLSDLSNYMIDEIKVKYHLEKFVSKSTRTMIEKQKSENSNIDLGAIGRTNLAFIFSDVRGFTSFSEKEDPGKVIEVLNFYLELQSKIIKSNMGDIDDYVGDQIMSHFSGEKRIDRAIYTAMKIMTELDKVNKERRSDNQPIFEVGIGIHDGNVVVGNIGSKFRMDFTCVGDAVNLTSRLCSSADSGEILVSLHCFKQAKKKYKKIDCDPIDVKGKEKQVQIVKIVW